ncbi:MAG: hypothetical protein WB870_13070 [Gallionellaceae bacterium]
MKHYLRLWLSFTAALILSVAIFNIIVDPYGMFRLVDRPGFNRVKPAAGPHGAMAKAYQVLRVQPRGLIFGNSRSEVGIDPESPAWPESTRPVFNLALPGTGPQATLRYLQHVLANSKERGVRKPEVVVWGIDFMDFLVDASEQRPVEAANKDVRLLANPDGSRNAYQSLQKIRDYTEATLTLAAFLDSVGTITNRENPFSEDLTPLGFNPMRDYLKIEADEGYHAVFRQKDIENTRANLRRPKDLFDADGRSSSAFDALRQVMALCRQNHIALYLIIFPYHAHLQEIIRITGHWPAFESWKREIVHIAETADTSHGKAVQVWDFSAINELTSEAVPPVNDRSTVMRWYWEAGHFKRELGDMILNRIFARAGGNDHFGVRLTSDNVDSQIAAMRAQETSYRQSHPQDMEELEAIATDIESRQRKR